ncbi:hypothetical protein AAC387_Pa05g3484 [Persea americana]
MEISFLKALINNISEFSRLSSSNNIKSEPIQSYHQKIDEALKLLRLILDEIVDSEISSDEGFNEALKELNAVVNEARDLIEGWQQMTSKLYFVLQIESLMAKMQKYGVEICGLVNSLLPSITLTSDSLSIQQCVQMFQLIVSEQTSDVIKESMRYVQENAVPSSESLLKIANSLSLISNQELLLEAVALEKVKTKTYERAYIRRWLDQGLAVCPKTRQTLSHTNLIPNYTVKALIANWCELHNIKLPDPIKSVSSNQSQVLPHLDCNAGDPLGSQAGNASGISVSPESIKYVVGSQSHRSVSSNVNHKHDKSTSPLHLNSFSKGRAPLDTPNGLEVDIGRVSLGSAKDVETVSDGRSAGSDGQALVSTREDLSEVSRADEKCPSHNQSTFSSAISSSDCQQGAGYANEASRLSGDLSNSSSHASSELTSEALGPALVPALAPAPDPPSREKEFSSRLAVARSKSHNIWRRPSAILFSRMASSPASVSRPDLSGVETQVRKLIEDLQSGSGDLQRDAAAELRLLAKHSMDNRIVIANCGAIDHLVHLLHSADLKTQENAVTALLNLSINDNNKISIVNAGAIDPLIHVLKTGNAEAKENSAATLFSLSVIEENKVKIGRSGAIRPLVELLGNGTPRGKKDAATALFNLSIFHENKVRIVQAGAVKCLVELMDPAAGMADKAVAVLANISTIPEGRNAIGQEGGIPVLVEVVELGSSRGKENAAAALLQLCTNNVKFCTMALQEGVVPPLVALSQSGTPRAKEKAQALLSYFRSQRHGNARRA